MLAVIAAVMAALYLGVFLGPSATPKLGLDLRGGTQVILVAKPLHGGTVTQSALDQAVNIIRNRVNGAGVGGAEISTQGNNDIIVSAPGASRAQLQALDSTALLRFRQVLAGGSYTTQTVAPPSSSAAPSTSGTPAATPTPSASKTSAKDRLPAALLAATTAPTPTPTPSATSSVAATPSGSASASPSPSASASGAAPEAVPGAQGATFAAVAAAFQAIDCVKTPNPTLGLDDAKNYIVACDPERGLKELLAPAAVEGSSIGSADATVLTTTNEWIVQLSFKGKGINQWASVTATAAKQPDLPSCSPPSGCNAVAIVLDGEVVSAPRISDPNGIPGGQAQISGSFTQKTANNLANVLKYGALPLKLEKLETTTVSPTLGSAQLRGGLIAGIIGLGLVILYSLLYYRGLGLVTIASLGLSGALLYAATTVLGHSSLGYTLSLPGIAGFIVAVGITADSFVVYFERIRDEVREGKRFRSAVERAWPRARRTIISADAVSLLAAVVLYLVSIGDVRGFAFTLGLSTLSDLFIVFYFTKPLLALMARRRAFDRGAPWTGVGRARAGATLESKEA
jgi:preprotein translocase subunit SecD